MAVIPYLLGSRRRDDHLVKHNYEGNVAPSVNDDEGEGYYYGSLWMDVLTQELYICKNPASGAAVWQLVLEGKQTIWVPAGAMTSRTTAGAEATTREINGITIPVLKFNKDADEGANFSITFPKSWDKGTITFQPFWTQTGGAASETVEFELRGGCFADDAAINTTGFGTAVAVSDTRLADNDVHTGAASAAVTLSNAADDTVAFFEIIRDVSDDTLAADAELIGVKIIYIAVADNDN